MKAHAADALVETIGANVHLHYDNSPYAKRFDDLILPRLKELGTRHVRDGAITWQGWERDWGVANLKKLGAAGIRLDLVINRKSPWGDETRFDELGKLAAHLGNVASFEGVNEPDIQGDMPDWVPTTRRLQEALYKAVKPLGIPVLAPSLVKVESAAKLGDLSAFCDVGNMHSYAAAGKPSSVLDNDLKTKGPSFGFKPPMVTECGYHNAISVQGGHRPQSEASAGTYAPVLFLEGFRRNFLCSYWYEFIDQYPDPGKTDPEKNFGLLRNDGSPKPAFTAIKRLIALHTDPGKPFAPKDLELSVKGPDSTRSLLFQKSDGTYLLDVWRDVEVGTKAAEVTVKLPKAIAGYTLHPFDGASVPVKMATKTRTVLDIINTIDPATDRLLYTKEVERTEVVGAGGADLITVPVGSSVVTLEIGGM